MNSKMIAKLLCAASVGFHAPVVNAGEYYSGAYEVARSTSDAFRLGQSRRLRIETVRQLEGLPKLERDGLVDTIRATLDVAKLRGVHGLEGVLSSSLAALESRGYDGWLEAREFGFEVVAVALRRTDTRPNALLPIARPGSPLAHFLPIGMVRDLLTTQTEIGIFDPETALAENYCNESAIAAATARWGAQVGDLLRQLCNSELPGPSGAGGELGLGFSGGLSVFDCMMPHEETRAERLTNAMRDCMNSHVDGGGSPYANQGGSVFDMVYPLREAPYKEETLESDGFGGWMVVAETYYTANPDDGGEVVYEILYLEDGATETRFTNDLGIVVHTQTRDERGEVIEQHFMNPDGSPLRDKYRDSQGSKTVDYGPDGSRLETTYDANGNIIQEVEYDRDHNKVVRGTDQSIGDGLGQTSECREFNLLIAEARVDGLLAEAGALDPRTVNPNPDADVTPSAGLDCMNLQGGLLPESSFACRNSRVLCAPGQTLDSNCKCARAATGVSPSQQCGVAMRCADGSEPVYANGTCSCTTGADPIVDPGTAPAPIPLPVNRAGRPGVY